MVDVPRSLSLLSLWSLSLSSCSCSLSLSLSLFSALSLSLSSLSPLLAVWRLFKMFSRDLRCFSLSNTGVSFFVINNFYFIFSHTTQHNIQNKTKQNSRHILNISRFNQKGGREGRTTRTQKSLLYIITYIQQKTLPSLNG